MGRRGRGRGRARRGDCGSASGRKRPRRTIEDEVEADAGEDLCFVCKDGGDLRVCDFRSCNKAYHPDCVGKDSNFLTSDEEFICDWHTCLSCEGRSYYYCFCCPRHAYCKRCEGQAEFVPVLRKTKGFCRDCLRMARMIEKNVDVDSDGERADFNDRETYEFLFKDYWEVVKDKEGLTLEHLDEAYDYMKKGLSGKQVYLEKAPDEEGSSDSDFMGHCDDDDDDEQCTSSYSKGQSKKVKKELKEGRSKKNYRRSWGSEALMKFLSVVGKNTANPLDLFGAAQVVKEYIRENNLLQKDKKKLVTCDPKLQFLFKKSELKYNKICMLLKKHIASNIASEDDTSVSSDNNDLTMKKKSRTANYVSNTSEHTAEIDKRCFASIESHNIKLIYLKRSLVLNLLKQPDTFESKVTGCFVRVKSDPRNYNYYMSKKSHQLGQVTGIRKSSEEYKIRDISTDVLLCIYSTYDIRISMLSDEDFEKDECDDLLQLAKEGSFKRLTVGELEEKARSIHRDIVSHAIDKEIKILEKQIELAHLKGWRSEMYESMDKKKLLSEPSERQRRLEEVPKVIPDIKDSNQLHIPAQDKSTQNGTVAFQATNEDANGGTVEMNVQKQGNEDMDRNLSRGVLATNLFTLFSLHDAATKADTYGNTSATHVQRQRTEGATKPDTNGDASATHVQRQSTEAGKIPRAREQKSEATKAETNGEISATGVQRQSTEAIKADTNCDTSTAHVQRQNTEAKKTNTAGEIPRAPEQKSEATKVDANVDMSATHVQRQSTEAKKTNTAGKIPRTPEQKSEATKADANGDTSATHVQWQSTEANKSNSTVKIPRAPEQKSEATKADTNGDTFATHVQRHSTEALDAGMETRVVIDLEADENPCKSSGQAAIIDLEAADAGDAHPVPHGTSNNFQRTAIPPRRCVWYYVDPQGEEQGPFTMEELSRWWDASYFPIDFKVWREGQTRDSAVFLRDVLYW